MRQQVTQGQEIGLAGQTGGVDRPQLHFEIRYAPTPKDKARPIDPMLVLPVKKAPSSSSLRGEREYGLQR